MRNRLIYSLLSLFMLFFIGAATSMLYLYRTTTSLQSVIDLHKVEIIRQDLVINTQIVQTNLYTFGTVFGSELDVIVDNVMQLGDSAQNCLSCHHNKETKQLLIDLNDLVEQYMDSISYLITTTANPERIERLRTVSINIGNMLLTNTQEMAFIAGKKLSKLTIKAIKEIKNSRVVLVITLVISFFIALTIAITMTRQITEPIYALVNAARKIQSGDLGYTTEYRAKGEFGELIASFNDMSLSLKHSNQKVMQHLSNLSNLYSTTLTFHAITNKADIYRELVYGVAELVGAEQCGLMLAEGDEFVHVTPAVGIDEEHISLMRVPATDIINTYQGTRRRALLINDNLENSPTAETDLKLGVRNLMFVWVRQKGDLIGAIRVANKKTGEFTDEDAQPLAILANNLSVALENAELYSNLRSQMNQLQDAQEQLVQAAKLVAIGELASNIAHEINNPLTSILGYAELIKEETDIESIMRDVDIIEKESLRARDIVQQLLEFARKRSLETVTLDINVLLLEAIELVSVQVKDTRIEVREDFGDIPTTLGDANQLKQVFINIINNAVFAMQDKGVLGISTRVKDGKIKINISDTGRGIPVEVISRIFEPFFSTKKEKGTGIGLSVSYKIIRSHNGRIDVESKEDEGSTFIVTLPILKKPLA